ncbi:MAG TPA: hypothetical protein VIT00_09680 [Terrimicrobiaceae bacterium]
MTSNTVDSASHHAERATWEQGKPFPALSKKRPVIALGSAEHRGFEFPQQKESAECA